MNRQIIYLSSSFPGSPSHRTHRDTLGDLWEHGWAVICPSLVQDWILRHRPDTRMLYALQAARTMNAVLLAGCDALFLMPGWAFCEEGHALYTLAERYGVKVFCASAGGGIPYPERTGSCHS